MILATLFNSLRRYRKEQGRLMLYFIQEYIPEGRLIRVEGPINAQYVPLMKIGETAQFDVVVDEAPSSPNLKEQVFGVMQTIAPQLLAMGVKIPTEALDYLPLPESLVQAIRQANDGQQQPTDPATDLVNKQIALDQMKAQSDAQIAQTKLDAETQIAQTKLESETTLKQRQLEADVAVQQQKLALEKAQVDQQMQIESMRMQLEQIKMQAMLNKLVPGATSELENAQQMLYETVAALHQNVQTGLGDLTSALKSTADRQSQAEDRLVQHSDLLQQLLSGHQKLNEQLTAPREVIRDEFGRVKGSRIVTNGSGQQQ